MKKKSNAIIYPFLAFSAVICVLFCVLPKSDFSEKEKRALSAFPTFSFRALKEGDYTADLEKWLCDHTPFRTAFMGVHAYWEWIKGNNGADGVYLGKDGWLFEKPCKRENEFQKNVEAIDAFAVQTKVPTSVMIVPVKGYFYGDYLPKGSLEYLDGEYLDSIRFSTDSGVSLIDVRPAFNAQKNERQLFYKTDHHWTSYGAYLAYTVAAEQLGFTPFEEADFDIEIYPSFYGTSYSKSCYLLTAPDDLIVMRSRHSAGNAAVTFEDGSNIEKHDNMFFSENGKGSDKYTVFLGTNHGFTRIVTGNEGKKLLVIKDSFAHCMVPFLAEHYSEIIMLDLRYYKKSVSAVMNENGIDEVLYVFETETFAGHETGINQTLNYMH